MIKIKKNILRLLHWLHNKPTEVKFSNDIENIQLLEYELGKSRLKCLLKSIEIKTVIDIGASFGDFISLVRDTKKNITILGFEPILTVFNSLQDRCGNANEISLYNLALGEFDGVVDFHENEYTYSSSILPIGNTHIKEFPYTKNYKTSQVKIASLDAFLRNKNLEKPILIKVDVQGYEEKVISGGKKIFAQADYVIIELSFCELYVGQALFDDINNELNKLGLFYAGCISQLCSPHDKTILQQDALYIRR
jgi:FkbM family methyltransferase